MKFIYCLLILFLIGFTGNAQVTKEKIIAAYDSLNANRPAEQAFLHTDSHTYAPGSSVRFKGYVLMNGGPSELSKVGYVTISDPAGRIITKEIVQLVNGSCQGTTSLPSDMSEGLYTVSFFTRWMMNEPASVYSSRIKILGKKTVAGSGNAAEAKIFFVPEGGNLVPGTENKTVILAQEKNGRPLSYKAKVIDEGGREVAGNIVSDHGLAAVKFTPVPGVRYMVVFTEGPLSGTEHYLNAGSSAITLMADNASPSRVFAKVLTTAESLQKYPEVTLIGSQNDNLVYFNTLALKDGSDAVNISKKTLAPGILRLNLLDGHGNPLAERLVFIADKDVDSIPDLNARVNNVVSTEIPVSGFDSLSASISVVEDVYYQDQTPGIKSWLFVNSGIGNGQVLNRYFDSKENPALMDLVMLAYGWKRYTVNDIFAKNYKPITQPFERSLNFAGKIYTADGKTVLPGGRMNFIINGADSSKAMMQTTADKNGLFVVDNLNVNQSAKIFYQGNNAANAGKIVQVKMLPDFIDTLKLMGGASPVDKNSVTLPTTAQALLDSINQKITTLGNVTVRAKAKSAVDSLDKIYVTNIFANADQSFGSGQAVDVWDYIKAQVTDITIDRNGTDGIRAFFTRFQNPMGGGEAAAEYSTKSPTDRNDNSVMFYLNDIPVDEDVIDNLSLSDISLFKVYKGVSGVALGAKYGAIAIWTEKDVAKYNWRQKGFESFVKKGFNVPFEYLEGAYLLPEFQRRNFTSLYWNPELRIKDGKAAIKFLAPDHSCEAYIIGNGVDANGKLWQINKKISVK